MASHGVDYMVNQSTMHPQYAVLAQQLWKISQVAVVVFICKNGAVGLLETKRLPHYHQVFQLNYAKSGSITLNTIFVL